MPRVVVASFNVHGGVDGWGRPFDVRRGVPPHRRRRLDAPGVVVSRRRRSPWRRAVARRLGYDAVELSFARGRIVAPPDVPPDRWGPRLWARNVHGMRLDRRRAQSARTATGTEPGPAPKAVQRGTWGIAVLSRLAGEGSQTIDLGKLPTDPAVGERSSWTSSSTGPPSPCAWRVPISPTSVRVHRSTSPPCAGRSRPQPGTRRAGRRHELVGTTSHDVLLPGWVARGARSHVADMVVVALRPERPHPRAEVHEGRIRRGPAHRRLRPSPTSGHACDRMNEDIASM